MMKKSFALLIALMMLFSFAAMAETAETAEVLNVEELYAGVWTPFVDDGFELYLPSDWTEVEITEEILSTGIYYAIASEDSAYTFSVAWGALEASVTAADLHTILAEQYPGAELLTIGEKEMVCYADATSNVLAFAMADETDPGMYIFSFTPVDDDTVAGIATLIMSSMRPLTAE